jgi:RNA polymerase-binding transcription factor DksA
MATAAELGVLRKSLEARLGELRSEIEGELATQAGEHYREMAGEVTDTADEAVGAELTGTENALIGFRVHEVRDIEAALARIADGSYGRCIDCRGAIDSERLAAYPTCERCEPCQRVHEHTFAGGAHRSL